ncbi:shikimate kinase [Candidatus Endobugula sertula]|uniref:Shikimate kinase n=1 Tax=Candidatus Endobugula sertula TaxID=62101 RepID=A0A1D2QRV1_9GAMM|nr:shikimate kinase [Candidatus Endobugula sertula]
MRFFQKIVLVGPMGAGKSTIGRLLAHHLSLPFRDSDHVVEERSGADISWIFDMEGEAGFRDRETAALEALVKEEQFVLATGGGIILRQKNRELIQQAEAVIFLIADPEHLVQRTYKDKKRPLLQVDNPREKILALLEEREPLYREVATHSVVTDTQSPKAVVQRIVSNLKGDSADDEK